VGRQQGFTSRDVVCPEIDGDTNFQNTGDAPGIQIDLRPKEIVGTYLKFLGTHLFGLYAQIVGYYGFDNFMADF
jgi:hypothetical protein